MHLSRRAVLAFATLSVAGGGLAPSARATTFAGPVGVTCLNRTSDGFNGCWGDDQTPHASAAAAVLNDGCNSAVLTYDKNTPVNGHGVTRTNLIAGISAGYFGTSAPGTWVGPGSATVVPGIREDDVPSIYIPLGRTNSYAHIWITASGPTDYGCAIYPG